MKLNNIEESNERQVEEFQPQVLRKNEKKILYGFETNNTPFYGSENFTLPSLILFYLPSHA